MNIDKGNCIRHLHQKVSRSKIWFRLLYLNNLVLPSKSWKATRMEEYFESVTPTRWIKPALVIKPKERIAAFKQCRAPKPEWQWPPLDNFGVLNEIDQQYCKDGQAQPLPSRSLRRFASQLSALGIQNRTKWQNSCNGCATTLVQK